MGRSAHLVPALHLVLDAQANANASTKWNSHSNYLRQARFCCGLKCTLSITVKHGKSVAIVLCVFLLTMCALEYMVVIVKH